MPSDDARDDRIVVLTYAYWARRFGGDPSVLGRTMTIDGARATVVGVLQRDGRSARARRRAVLGGALADADAKGPVLHDGARPAAPRRLGDGGGADASGHQRAALPDLAVVVPGREGDVGAAGPEDPRGRRRRLDAGLRAGRGGVRAAHRLRQRGQPADRAQPAAQPRAGDSRRARRLARPAAAARPRRSRRAHRAAPRWSASASPRRALQLVAVYGARLHSAHRRGAVLRDRRRVAGRPRGGQRHRHRHRAGAGTARGCGSIRRCAPAGDRRPTDRRRAASSARWSPRSSRSPRRCSSPACWSSPASIG